MARIPCARAPYAVAGGIKAIAAGYRHVCALDTSGVATCWGLNSYGEVGRPSLDVIYTAPQQVPGSHSFASIYAGDSFTCGLTTDARAWCWGIADRGQLGDVAPLCKTLGPFPQACTPTPLAVRDGAAYSALWLGAARACATTGDGTARCLGLRHRPVQLGQQPGTRPNDRGRNEVHGDSRRVVGRDVRNAHDWRSMLLGHQRVWPSRRRTTRRGGGSTDAHCRRPALRGVRLGIGTRLCVDGRRRDVLLGIGPVGWTRSGRAAAR